MWPHKKGLGVQLSYGVKGNGNIIPTPETEPNSIGNLQFPILDEPQLNRISETPKRLVGKQNNVFSTETRDIRKKTNSTVVNPDTKEGSEVTAISNELLEPLKKNSQLLEDISAFDPTFSNTIEFFDTRIDKQRHSWRSTVAYATGSSGHILHIALVTSHERVKNEDKEILIPTFNKGISLAFMEPIKQILAFKPLIHDNEKRRDYLLVRTHIKIYLLYCTRTEGSGLPFSLSLVDELNSADFGGQALADFSWNPKYTNGFMVVDIKGNTYKVSITSSIKLKVTPIISNPGEPTLENSVELSNWHRIIWTKPSEVIVSSRSSLIQMDLVSKTNQKIVTADTWSRIQELCVPAHQNKYMFLLTTREVIWIDISDGFKRLLSWKHFLAEDDPSLKLMVNKEDDKFMCFIYSQLTPLVLCLNFGIKDRRPYCLSSPSAIYLHESKVPIQSLALVPLNRGFYKKRTTIRIPEKNKQVYGLFDLRINLELNMNILSYRNSKWKEPEPKNIDFLTLSKTIKTESLRKYSPLYFEKFSKNDLLPLVQYMVGNKDNLPDQIDRIQQYAFQLGEGGELFKGLTEKRNNNQESVDPMYSSLLDIADKIPDYIDDIEEVDSMLEQLSKHFEDMDIEVSDAAKHILQGFKFFETDPEAPTTVINTYKSIEKRYFLRQEIESQNRQSSLKQLAIYLVASLIKLRPSDTLNFYESLAEEQLARTSYNVKTIVSDWDNDFDEIPTVIDETTQAVREPISSIPPTINITSQDTSTQKKLRPKQRNRDLRRNVFLASSQVPSSQPETPFSSQLDPDTQSQTVNKSQTKSKKKDKSKSKSKSKSKNGSQSQDQSQPSQKRPHSSQPTGSQRPKKKRKSGFA